MQLKVRRTGGAARELHALVEEAKLDEVGEPGRTRGPDRFTYELTVDDRRVTLPESAMTPARRELVKRLETG